MIDLGGIRAGRGLFERERHRRCFWVGVANYIIDLGRCDWDSVSNGRIIVILYLLVLLIVLASAIDKLRPAICPKNSHACFRQTIFAVWYRPRVSSTTTVLSNAYNVSQAGGWYNPVFITYLAMLTWTQLRASRTAYLASAGAVGTVVAETSKSGDQSTLADVVPDVPAQSVNAEVDPVLIVVEPEPPKTVFPDLPEKVPFVYLFFFLPTQPTQTSLLLAALDIPEPYADVGPPRYAFTTRAAHWTSEAGSVWVLLGRADTGAGGDRPMDSRRRSSRMYVPFFSHLSSSRLSPPVHVAPDALHLVQHVSNPSGIPRSLSTLASSTRVYLR